LNARLALLTSGLFIAASALAAPKIENVSAKPSAADVQVSVSVSRTRFDTGGCDARVDFGDGQGRTIDFGMAGTRNVSHTYKKNGSYKVTVKGAGATPCEGSREAPVTISGVPEPKKPEAKKAEPAKKADAKKAPTKKPATKKPATKKPAPKKDEKKKDATAK
jgi:PKD repeat protein